MAAHILLDARKLADFGIGVYIENLIRGLLELQENGLIDMQLTLLIPPLFLEAGAPLGIQQLVAELDRSVAFVPEPAGKYSLNEYLLLAKRQRRHLDQAHVYHSPHFTLPFFLGVPSVVTIHDVIHVTQPEKLSHRLFARAMIRSAARRAQHIISVSAASAQMIRRTAAPLHTPITVVANALQAGIEVLPPKAAAEQVEQVPAAREPYCLFVGNDRPHKGFAELLEAWAILARRRPSLPNLIAVGERYGAGTHDQIRRLRIENKVKFAGYIPRDTLCALYNRAQVVVAPSREEGFGLVALEALACGVPVLCTPHASFQEVCGDSAWYAEDYSAEAIARAIDHVLADEVQRRRKAELGLERIRRYTRTAAAEKTCHVYEEVIRAAAAARQAGAARETPAVFSSSSGGQKIGMVVQHLEQAARRKL